MNENVHWINNLIMNVLDSSQNTWSYVDYIIMHVLVYSIFGYAKFVETSLFTVWSLLTY